MHQKGESSASLIPVNLGSSDVDTDGQIQTADNTGSLDAPTSDGKDSDSANSHALLSFSKITGCSEIRASTDVGTGSRDDWLLRSLCDLAFSDKQARTRCVRVLLVVCNLMIVVNYLPT